MSKNKLRLSTANVPSLHIEEYLAGAAHGEGHEFGEGDIGEIESGYHTPENDEVERMSNMGFHRSSLSTLDTPKKGEIHNVRKISVCEQKHTALQHKRLVDAQRAFLEVVRDEYANLRAMLLGFHEIQTSDDPNKVYEKELLSQMRTNQMLKSLINHAAREKSMKPILHEHFERMKLREQQIKKHLFDVLSSRNYVMEQHTKKHLADVADIQKKHESLLDDLQQHHSEMMAEIKGQLRTEEQEHLQSIQQLQQKHQENEQLLRKQSEADIVALRSSLHKMEANLASEINRGTSLDRSLKTVIEKRDLMLEAQRRLQEELSEKEKRQESLEAELLRRVGEAEDQMCQFELCKAEFEEERKRLTRDGAESRSREEATQKLLCNLRDKTQNLERDIETARRESQQHQMDSEANQRKVSELQSSLLRLEKLLATQEAVATGMEMSGANNKGVAHEGKDKEAKRRSMKGDESEGKTIMAVEVGAASDGHDRKGDGNFHSSHSMGPRIESSEKGFKQILLQGTRRIRKPKAETEIEPKSRWGDHEEAEEAHKDIPLSVPPSQFRGQLISPEYYESYLKTRRDREITDLRSSKIENKYQQVDREQVIQRALGPGAAAAARVAISGEAGRALRQQLGAERETTQIGIRERGITVSDQNTQEGLFGMQLPEVYTSRGGAEGIDAGITGYFVQGTYGKVNPKLIQERFIEEEKLRASRQKMMLLKIRLSSIVTMCRLLSLKMHHDAAVRNTA